jgi:hypothetical protein
MSLRCKPLPRNVNGTCGGKLDETALIIGLRDAKVKASAGMAVGCL